MQPEKAITIADIEQIFGQAVEQQQKGNLEEANKLYQQIVRVDPKNIAVLNNLSLVLKKLGKLEQAAEVCQHMIKVQPGYIHSYDRLGKICLDTGRYDEAIDYFRRALSIERKASILFSLSIPYYLRHDYKEAEKLLKESLKLFPDNPAAHMNIALVYYDIKQLNDAERHAREAVRLDPKSVDAIYNLGKILSAEKKIAEAMQCFRDAIAIDPTYSRAAGSLLKEMQTICDWNGVAELWPQVKEQTKKQIEKNIVPGWYPFADLSISDDPAENMRLSNIHAREIEEKTRIAYGDFKFDFAQRRKTAEKKKLTIGYLSFDFREHPFAHLTRELFISHNKQRFNIFAYAIAPSDGSEIRKIYEKTADRFRDVSGLSDRMAAQQIYDDEVDIMVDATGHTAGARLGIAALHPAPVQVNVWGFPGTVGGSIMDYIIADELVVPEDQQEHYSEKLVYLPNTLQIGHKKEKISTRVFSRSECGLPDEGIVFCCLNAPYKFEPVMFDAWMRIMKQLPESALWLRKANEIAIINLRKEAEARGIEGRRIIFAERMDDRPDYFKRIQLADIGLDPRIYNGGSTTIDTLWAGVPVITLLGKHYASRMSSGFLHALEMQECITKNMEEYEKTVLHYAKNPEELKKIKQKLWENREKCALFDTKRFVANLEKAYEIMWKIHVSGQKPQKIAVSE